MASLMCLGALLGFNASAQVMKTLTPITTFGPHGDGSYQPGDASFITSASSQRGIAYNPVTGHIIFVDREIGGAVSASVTGNIYVLDGTTGTVLGTLNTNGISGGDYADYAVQVDDAGVIYIGNFVNTGASFYKLYRWDSESSATNGTPPLMVYNADPGSGHAQRWGSTMDLRNSGVATQIILGSQTQSTGSATNIAILTTMDGTNFTATTLTTDIQENDSAFGIAFGTGNTFWTKNIGGRPLRQLSFDLGTSNAVTVRNLNATNLPSGDNLGPIAIDSANNLLAAMEITSSFDVVRLYDISNTNIAPVLMDVKTFPVNFANVSATAGFLDFGGGKLYAHSINNGLLAFTVGSVAATTPIILSHPAGPVRKASGQTASFSVLAYPGTSYQWLKDSNPISGGTNSVLNLANLQTNQTGFYSVVVSNSAGTVTSSTAQLTVLDPSSLFRLTSLWSIAPNSRTYVTSTGGAGTPNERFIGYSAISNEIYVVSHNAANYVIAVLNATNGVEKGFLNTNGVNGGSVVYLNAIAVASDGSIYIANTTTPATEAAPTKIYRWANSNPSTVPVLVYSGVPDSSVPGGPSGTRWGDVMTIRGSGLNTQILLDNWVTTSIAGSYGAVLRPTDVNLTNFTATGNVHATAPNLKIGRSIQWDPNGNDYWAKKGSNRLEKFTFDLDGSNGGLSAGPTMYTNFPVSLGYVAMDFSRNLLAGVNYAASTASPQQVVLYEVSDLNSPLLLDTKNFPANKSNNNNILGNIIFGANNLLVAMDGNNGVAAFVVDQGPPVPPAIQTQPSDLRLVIGGTGTLSVSTPDSATFQWRLGGTNIPGATANSYTIANAQFTNAGNYSVVLSNAYGATLSSNAAVTIVSPNDVYQLSPAWSAAPGSQPYVTDSGNANSPNERTLAYNSLSNQVLVVRALPNSTDYGIQVVDATTGVKLYDMNTNGVQTVVSELSGSSALYLCAIAVADDGAVYACNGSPNASGGTNAETAKMFRVYRWANSGPSTLPVNIFTGDPANQTANVRWGDVMSVRGSGTNTELVLDSKTGSFAALLKPTDASMATFTNYSWASLAGDGSIGRSLQFETNNTVWQKHKGTALKKSSYSTNSQTSALLASYSFPSSLGPVAIDHPHNLMVGLDFFGSTNGPDAVALYEISSFSSPLLVAKYNFPQNARLNDNFIGQCVVAGTKVYALNGNNGLLSFNLVPPTGPALSIARLGSTVQLTWPDGSYILQGTTNLNPTIIWSDISTAGETNKTESAASGNKFYRLKK